MLTAAEGTQGEQLGQELRITYEDDAVTAFIGAAYFHEEGSRRTPSQTDERVLLARLTGTLNDGPLAPGCRPAIRPAALFAKPLASAMSCSAGRCFSALTMLARRSPAGSMTTTPGGRIRRSATPPWRHSLPRSKSTGLHSGRPLLHPRPGAMTATGLCSPLDESWGSGNAF